jgi:hypothetical protein
MSDDDGVEANSRLTGVVGALLLVALAVEGVTVPDVTGMLGLHVFVGLFVIPVVCLKLGTTGYRFFHYYRGAAAYRRKGPPHPILRVTSPLVVLTTVSLLGTGVLMLVLGPNRSDLVLTLHQGSFVAWFVFTTIHVLGHAVESWRLTTAEVRARPRIPGRNVRLSIVGISVVVGLALGVASFGWTSAWTNRAARRERGAPATIQLS